MMMEIHWERNAHVITCRLTEKKMRCYLAQIVGSDPNYILKREFIDEYAYYRDQWGYLAEFYLVKDGIYDFWMTYPDAERGRIQKERKWLIRFGEQLYIYDGSEMNAQYVLYTLLNLNLQTGDLPAVLAKQEGKCERCQ